MFKIRLTLTAAFACLSMLGIAQNVLTIAGPNSGINDALIVDSLGNIYGSDFGGSTTGASSVYKIDTAGELTTFSTGYSSCNGLAFDHEGALYVVDFTASINDHQIYKLDTAGAKTPYGPKIPGASGIIFDPLSDTLYVSQYSGNDNHIYKLAPDGNLSVHSDHSALNGPVGMAFDSSHILYVANFTDGKIFSVDSQDGSLSQIVDLPHQSFWGVGFLTFAAGHLYATGIGTHKIYQVSLTGEVTELAGSGTPGLTDGFGSEAQFNRPNGIATNASQDKLYVSDLITSAVRVIDLDQISDQDETTFYAMKSIEAGPNPADEFTTLSYHLGSRSALKFKLYSDDGRLIKTLFSGEQSEGLHKLTVNTHTLPQGIYYCRLESNRNVQTIKISVHH